MPSVDATEVSSYQRFRAWLVGLAQTRYAVIAMVLVSIVDGSVFPIPPFALLIPMALAHPRRAFRYAAIGTVASIFGGFIGFALGRAIAQGLTTAFHLDPNLPIHFAALGYTVDTTLARVLNENVWVLGLACAFLPTPYKVVAIGSGLVGVELPRFVVASVIGRTLRFYIFTYLALLAQWQARKLTQKKSEPAARI